MSDRVTPTWGGFVEIQLRSGWRGLLRVDDIVEALPRREGGTSIRCRNLRTILVDVPTSKVIDAMAKASAQSGGCDEASR
jgi:hypothetical protein